MNDVKFIHMADLHLGSNAYKNLNIDEFELLFNIVNDANNNECNIMLIAGDIFDNIPSLNILHRFNSIISEFNGDIFIILGNHDFNNIKSPIDNFDFAKNIHIFSSDNLENIYINKLNLRVYGFSYNNNEITQNIYNNINFNLNKNEINILLAHGGDEKHIPTNFTDLEKVGFNYVAFGHIHKHNAPRPSIVYCGSLIPMDKTELGIHGYILGQVSLNELNYRLIDSNYSYEKITLDVSDFYNIEDIYKTLYNLTFNNNRNYIVHLVGKLFYELKLNTEHLMRAGDIIDIIDETELDIDYEELKKYNENNILGVFIKKLQDNDDDLSKLALQYGVRAFLEAKDNAN